LKRFGHKGIKLGDNHRFILACLYREQPLTLREMQNKVVILASQFGDPSKVGTDMKLEEGILDLRGKGYVEKGDEGLFRLTEEGMEVGRLTVETLEGSARTLRALASRLLVPDAVAKVTIAVDLLLAVMKLMGGVMTGSVALMADGADAAVDTASALVVWLSIRIGRELLGTAVIIAMMLITAISIGYESATSLLEHLGLGLVPISQPVLVIGVEAVVLLAAAALYNYQNYVGKRYGNLSLISQSVDSRNHIYVAWAVIMGAAFSMFGILFVDSLIGEFIALRMALDAVELTREVLSRMEGEKTDYTKYRTFLEEKLEGMRTSAFENWILFTLREKGESGKEELVQALNYTFSPGYVPILSEFNVRLGADIDFDSEFEAIMAPLLEGGYVDDEGGVYRATVKGKTRVGRMFKTLRYTSMH
jgi:divalent metal cation (Fe/Co/Zn/Cd) transporter